MTLAIALLVAAALAAGAYWYFVYRAQRIPPTVRLDQKYVTKTGPFPKGSFGPGIPSPENRAADAKVAFAMASSYDPALVDLKVLYLMLMPALPFDPTTCDDATGKVTGNEPSMVIRGKLVRNMVLTPTEYAFLKYQSGGDRTFRADNELGTMVLNK